MLGVALEGNHCGAKSRPFRQSWKSIFKGFQADQTNALDPAGGEDKRAIYSGPNPWTP